MLTPGQEALGAVLLVGAWVIGLSLIGDRLAQVPTLLLMSNHPDDKARQREIATPELLKRRMLIVSTTMILPSAVLTGAIALLGRGPMELSLLRYLWTVVLIATAFLAGDWVLARRRHRDGGSPRP